MTKYPEITVRKENGMNIANKTVLITGANRGIGLALVNVALRRGVNFFGLLKVQNAFLPLLRRSKGAIVNNLSLTALAPWPVIPACSVSKAAAFNQTHSLRVLLAGEDEIFPDPASLSIADGRRTGAVKALERQFTAFVPESAASLA